MKNLSLIAGLLCSTLMVSAQTVMCTEEVIDSLESGSPFMVGHVIEWIALGDDNILIESGGDDNTTLLLDGVDSAGGSTPQGTVNSISMDSPGLEAAESTSSQTCNPSPLTFFNIQMTLPVTWSKPTNATIMKDRAEVVFSTTQEINNSHFEIEHSREGKDYKVIGNIEGEGNTTIETNYHYIHERPLQGINYYRVKQVDFDGQYSYSNVASVRYEVKENRVYPNPIDQELNIISNNQEYIQVFSHLGELVGEYLMGEGQNSINISHFNKGLYLVKFSNGDIKKVVKN